MAVGGLGLAGLLATRHVKVDYKPRPGTATSQGHILKDYHALETTQKNYYATLGCAIPQVI